MQTSAIADLEEKYAAENRKDYVTAVHALKGLSRTLGFEDLGVMAEKVQYAGQDGKLTDDMHKELMKKYYEISMIARKCMF